MRKKKKETKVWTGLKPGTTDFKLIKDSVNASFTVIQEMEEKKAELLDNFTEIHAKTGIPKRVWNKLVRWTYDGRAEEQFSKDEELQEAWMALHSDDEE